MFGDSGDNDIGKIEYTHTDNIMKFGTGASEKMRILGGGQVYYNCLIIFQGTPLGEEIVLRLKMLDFMSKEEVEKNG